MKCRSDRGCVRSSISICFPVSVAVLRLVKVTAFSLSTNWLACVVQWACSLIHWDETEPSRGTRAHESPDLARWPTSRSHSCCHMALVNRALLRWATWVHTSVNHYKFHWFSVVLTLAWGWRYKGTMFYCKHSYLVDMHQLAPVCIHLSKGKYLARCVNSMYFVYQLITQYVCL